MSIPLRSRVPHPVFRKLRVFAFDPGTTAQLKTPIRNEMTLAIPWESLEPGPRGEYVEVVDCNQSEAQIHEPVNLDSKEVLAQNGLSPSDGNPQFRQQMVYAVAMYTIRNFERALGRVVHWNPQLLDKGKRGSGVIYKRRLPLHPHYLEENNAYYSPENGVCFGYFRSTSESSAGTAVFSCLSQDVIAHDLTHALLHGMAINFEGNHEDVMAFHEAFSDLVALLQHFSLSDVLRSQIASIRGSLDVFSWLGAVAPQFGEATGRPEGIRNALGKFVNGQWQTRVPDPKAYTVTNEPHERGDILVAAVFEALKRIYESRVSDLRRIASKGTGVLPEGDLHPDLVNRLAQEVSRTAHHVLVMCLRALDYLPPIEMTFGDYLRAIVTADYDAMPSDSANYRLAFVEAFRRYGILPADVRTLSEDTLLWSQPPPGGQAELVSSFVRQLSSKFTPWNLPQDRQQLWELLMLKRAELHDWLSREQPETNLGPINLRKPFEVQSFHPREVGDLTGDFSFQWVIKIVQKGPVRRRGHGELARSVAGVTLLVDADTGRVRYQIEKKGVVSTGGQPPDHMHLGPLKKVKEAASEPIVLGGKSNPQRCAERRLRVFSFDPSLGGQLETAQINEVEIGVPWERDPAGADILKPGPVGEYLEVVDRDPASGCFYDPVDLQNDYVLAQDGLPPSESNPQFHQQMVYAVAMRTIRNFERALGRLALWRAHRVLGEDGKILREEYVPRLRLYPHALREANAYYSPDKKAILFGYFPALMIQNGNENARPVVFTCLSHDIIAHEMTHALLDGMHRRFNEPSNPDVLAFHEAFADLVALFQHFSLPSVLRHQIASTRGDLASQNRLGELAQQLGQAVGKRGALRNAIGEIDPATQKWHRTEPTSDDYHRHQEPHDRGAVLVAAVFDAFLSIYKGRIADLLRIASEGTGVLPEGNLHPDLVNRLADEAARSARHVLDMCIRALDYCPPVDITFGDYLRAIVTADFEYDPIDEEHRRVAFVESFRRRGIVPEAVKGFSVDGLLWRPSSAAPDEDEEVVVGIVKSWASDIRSWGLSKNRQALYDLMQERRAALHEYLRPKLSKESVVLSGIDPELNFEVHSVRPSLRLDWEGKPNFQWVIELTQRVPQYFDEQDSKQKNSVPDYYFRGGCTLLVDASTGKVRYSIKKRLDQARKERQRRYFIDDGNRNLRALYFGRLGSDEREPFAMLHRS